MQFQLLSEIQVKKDCDLKSYPNLKVYVQPGGNAYDQEKGLSDGGKKNILDYIKARNGIYVGTCAGMFLAASDYWWEGVHYAYPDLLGLTPTLEGSIASIIDYPGYKVTKLSNGRNMVYYGGPTRGLNQTSKTGLEQWETLMTFADIPGDLPAAITKDNILLFSVHAEAYENDQITGLSNADRLDNYAYRAQQIKKVANLDWKIPAANQSVDNDELSSSLSPTATARASRTAT